MYKKNLGPNICLLLGDLEGLGGSNSSGMPVANMSSKYLSSGSDLVVLIFTNNDHVNGYCSNGDKRPCKAPETLSCLSVQCSPDSTPSAGPVLGLGLVLILILVLALALVLGQGLVLVVGRGLDLILVLVLGLGLVLVFCLRFLSRLLTRFPRYLTVSVCLSVCLSVCRSVRLVPSRPSRDWTDGMGPGWRCHSSG